MSTVLKVLLIILIILVIALVVLYFVGQRMQRKQVAQQEQMEAMKQTVSMLIIDKKKLPIKESGLPQMVIDQTPRLMRRSKLPIVKAKVGSRIMTLISDAAIFDSIPVKKEVKAVVSGIYIMEVRGVRGPLEIVPQKKGFWQRTREKLLKKAEAGTAQTGKSTKTGTGAKSGKAKISTKSGNAEKSATSGKARKSGK